MSDGTETRRVPVEGADMLILAGVNDSNLVELARVAGVKVSLRGDTMTIQGTPEAIA